MKIKCTIIAVLVYGVLSGPIDDDSWPQFVTGNHRFTTAIYKELIKNKKGNIIVSPFSAETVLALTKQGARGETATEMATGLSLPSSDKKTQKVFRGLLPELKRSDDDLKLLSANKIYVGAIAVEENFKSAAKDIYESGIENVDFTKSEETAKIINRWVEDNTNEKIKDLIHPTLIDGSTKMVLVNALYFDGKWVSRFEKNETKKKRFFKSKDDTVEIDTMHQVEYLKYDENPSLDAKFLELPYKGGDISMVIVLPNKIDGLANLEQNVEQIFQPQPFIIKKVDVELPRFTIETETDFVPILKTLGIRRLFGNGADLTGISPSGKDLYVSAVVQKAFINVTEAGTEAAAATSVVIHEKSMSRHLPVDFHVDRPFFYFIKFKDVILVADRYRHA